VGWGGGMARATKSLPDYRVSFVDADGELIRSQTIDASDDREAVKKARRLLGRDDIELWDGKRLVARLDHDRPWPKDE
jgi:hypothetical protein